MVAIRTGVVDFVDDVLLRRLGTNLGDVATRLSDLDPATGEVRNKPYFPKQVDETAAQRFFTGLGIGASEGAKDGVLKKLEDGAGGTLYEHTRSTNINDTGHIGYGLSVFDNVYRYYNDIHDQWVAKLLNKEATSPNIKSIKDTQYGPLRQESLLKKKAMAEQKDYTFSKDLPNIEDDLAARFGYALGRLGADATGYGTRKFFWNMHPEDAVGTYGAKILGSKYFLEDLGLEPSNLLTNSIRFGAAAGLGVGSQNWNPLNLTEGGRPVGFEAISEDPDDPRRSTNPVLDIIVARGILGNRGNILPWEQFTQERPDVTYDQYAAYRNYMYNRNPGVLSKATLGLVKGDMEGIDGESPELRVLGYRVTPEGIVGAGIGAAVPIAIAKGIQAIR